MLKGLPDTYKIIRRIAEGSGEEVYLAIHLEMKKRVVLKCLKYPAGELPVTPEAPEMVRGLRHANLPEVYDFLTVDGDVYVVMDFVPGRTLKDYLDEGVWFEEEDIVVWAKELCDAMNYLHTCSTPIAHCNLKPAEIMLKPDGHICLIDYNFPAVACGYGSRVAGFTPGYASPEQIQAMEYNSQEEDVEKWYSVDERADIYSFGAIIYHLLTGRKPVQRQGAIPEIHGYRSNVNRSLEEVIMRCLDESPGKRYLSAEKVLYALNHLEQRSEEDISAERKHRIAASAATLFLTISLLLIVGGVLRLFPQRMVMIIVGAVGTVVSIVLLAAVSGRFRKNEPKVGQGDVSD